MLGGRTGGESTEVEEVEHVLEVSDQSPPRDDTTPPNAAITELDLAAETANALDLLSAMFGEANADWGGAETVDSEVEVAVPDVDIPHPTPDPVESAIPAAPESLGFQRVGNKSANDGQAEATAPTPTATGPERPSTKLKDLFAPREEEISFWKCRAACLSQALCLSLTGFFSLIGHVDLDSELDLAVIIRGCSNTASYLLSVLSSARSVGRLLTTCLDLVLCLTDFP